MNRKLKEINNKLEAKTTAIATDKDEDKVAELMNQYGSQFISTHERNRFERWDVEGKDLDGNDVKIEVKTRTDGQHDQSKFTTWIVDQYKMDYLADIFPDDVLYYCNVYNGEYHLFSLDWIRSQNVVKKYAFLNGAKELRTFYEFPKDYFIVELKSGEKGRGYKRFRITEKDGKK